MTPKDRKELLDVIGLQGKRCAEIGVYKGDFAAEILKRRPAHLFLIDPWKQQPTMEYYDAANESQENFDQIYASVYERFKDEPASMMRLFSHEAVQHFDTRTLDFVWIDGNHTFAHTLYDMSVWSQKIKRGGWLCVHDFGGGSHFYGVRQAVNEFCKVTGNEIEYVCADLWAAAAIRIK